MQIHHLDVVQRRNLGDWLAKKYLACRSRAIAAERGLVKCGQPEVVLRTEWEAQQVAQRKPLQRMFISMFCTALLISTSGQSKNVGAKAIDSILLLQEQLRVFEETLADIERKILDGRGDANLILYRKSLIEDRSQA